MPRYVVRVGLLLLLGASGCDDDNARGLSDQRVPLEHATPVVSGAPGAVGKHGPHQQGLEPDDKFLRASTELNGPEKSELRGQAELEEITTGVRVEVNLSEVDPGKYAVVVHESGDCSKSGPSEEHFAPLRADHGLPSQRNHHLGDFGNIEVLSERSGRLKLTTAGGNLRPNDGKFTFLGRPLVIYAREDKGGGMPLEQLGAPIACGVIKPD